MRFVAFRAFMVLLFVAAVGQIGLAQGQDTTTTDDLIDPSSIKSDPVVDTEPVKQPVKTMPSTNVQPPVRLPTGPLEPMPTQIRQNSINSTNLNPLTFDISYPDSIVVNETAEVRVKVTNPNNINVKEARLILSLPKMVQFTDATPAPIASSEKQIEFALENIEAGQTKEVVIKVLPVDKQPITFETQLMIVNREQVQIAVNEPVLDIMVQGPERLKLGESATFNVSITNSGDGIARDVQIKPGLDPSMKLVQSTGTDLFCPELKAGETKNFEVQAISSMTGKSKIDFTATARSLKAKTTNASFIVVKPELEIQAIGPKTGFVLHQNTFGLTIKNTSDIDIDDVALELTIPALIQVHTVSRECNDNTTDGKLIWTLASLKAGESTEILWIASAQQPGNFKFDIAMTSKETTAKTISLPTTVEARPDLSISIRNLKDPVPAGEAAEYVITLENHGTVAASKLGIQVELPASWVAISKEDEALTQAQRSINFTVDSIASKEKREFRFMAESNVPGEYTVRAKLSSGSSSLSLTAEDGAFVYKAESNRVSEKSGPTIQQ